MPTVVFKRRPGVVAVWSLVWSTVIVMDTSGSTEEDNENGQQIDTKVKKESLKFKINL